MMTIARPTASRRSRAQPRTSRRSEAVGVLCGAGAGACVALGFAGWSIADSRAPSYTMPRRAPPNGDFARRRSRGVDNLRGRIVGCTAMAARVALIIPALDEEREIGRASCRERV